jgi:hypothetical protein
MWTGGDKVSTSLFFSHTSILRSFFRPDWTASLRIDALIRLSFNLYWAVTVLEGIENKGLIRFTPRPSIL